jgi:mRNA interferase HigB
MHVISFKKIRELIVVHPDSEAPLKSWYSTAKKAHWQNLAEVQQRYLHADLVGKYLVFNISHNKYRLIAHIVYRSQTIFVTDILRIRNTITGKHEHCRNRSRPVQEASLESHAESNRDGRRE